MQNNTFSSLIVGQKIVTLRQVDSTNNYLKLQLAKCEPLPEGTVILAEDQYAGRGQVRNVWHSQPGKNLTFSILLYPVFIKPDFQFNLNIAVSLAINDVLRSIVGPSAKIKWPNDIFYEDKKLGGVLIENSLQGSQLKSSVIGVGINVNQTSFPESVKNVSSLREILHQDYDLNVLLQQLCKAIERRYCELKENPGTHLTEYLGALYRFGEDHPFIIDGKPEVARIVGVNERGFLKLDINGSLRSFNLKEVSFVIR
ncbi:biotin--[acetyl-CoA-carboxylase] ligase [Desertivirga xinjiangensis]|uniref:biotin--[acetyl-CoA-carboxylase] ligase n=1 Tax=Desertivirga xinjiangensis TaxID=539206 RepID=UPI00210C4E38|nr:biotin--[acetyl-CoA-carboxylase] ligase [Pedobacter xinjiangensis]